jgi:hypothetical protein
MTTALVYKIPDQTISPSTWTKVTFTGVDHDPSGLYDSTNHRFVVPAGYTKARVQAQVWYGGQTPGARGVKIDKNGVDIYVGGPNADFSDTGTGTISMPIASPIMTVEEGDYFEVLTWHGHSSNKGLWGMNGGDDGNNWFSIELFP